MKRLQFKAKISSSFRDKHYQKTEDKLMGGYIVGGGGI